MQNESYFDEPMYEDREFSGGSWLGELVDDVEFFNCKFNKCLFAGADFKGSRFHHCQFINCDLSNVGLVDSSFSNTAFKDSKLLGVDWTKTKGRFMSIGIWGSVISYSSFSGMKFQSIKIIESTAKDVDFTEAVLQKADMSRTDFDKSKFYNTDLSGANFTDARNYAIDPRFNKLKGAKFSLPDAITLLDSFGVVVN